MKIRVLPADARGRVECVADGNILRHLPGLVFSLHEADVVIVVVSHYDDFVFNRELDSVDKPVVMMDFMEYYGQASSTKTHLFGVDHSIAWNLHSNPEWEKLHRFAEAASPRLYFKRELYSVDRSDSVIPIEWPCYLNAWMIEDKDSFDVRPFEVFFNWGMSNCIRPMIHGDMFMKSCLYGYEVISSFGHIDSKIGSAGRKWISIHSPHTHRTHINEIALRQAQSKMSVSAHGAGVKCFRSTEHLVHTVPVKLRDSMAWSFPWIHGINCLEMDLDYSDLCASGFAGKLNSFASLGNLHEIYVQAQELADKYRIGRYVHEYIIPEIAKRL